MTVDAAARATGADGAEYPAARASLVPMGHQGTDWDVAKAALVLVSDEAAFIAGVLLLCVEGRAVGSRR